MNPDHAIVIYAMLVIVLLTQIAVFSQGTHTRNEVRRQAGELRRVRKLLEEESSEFGPVLTGLVQPRPQPSYDDQLEDVQRYEQPELVYDQLAEVHDLSQRRTPREFGPA